MGGYGGGVQVSPEHFPWLVAGFVFTTLLFIGSVIIIEGVVHR